VKPKFKDICTQAHGKFVPTCHSCGKVGHVRLNCFLLKTHRSWIKQNALRKSEIEDSSSSQYVHPHRRHIKGKGNIVCKNANHICTKKVKQHSSKRSLPTCHHRSHPTQMSTSLGSKVEGSEGAASKSYIRHSGSTASAAVCSCQSEWQIKEEQIKALQEKAVEAH
jgi:hypothetical protein